MSFKLKKKTYKNPYSQTYLISDNKYLQWICYNLQDHLGQPYFRVISRINDGRFN